MDNDSTAREEARCGHQWATTYTPSAREPRSGVWWKRLLNVQAPYQWNLRRQHLGRTLDIGCGIGRNLPSLPPGSLGVDHNATSIATARARGLHAMTHGGVLRE